MVLKYHAIINHQEIDSSNSLPSLRQRMDEYIKMQPWENVYIVKGTRNPLIVGHVKYCVETNNYLFNGHRSISNIK